PPSGKRLPEKTGGRRNVPRFLGCHSQKPGNVPSDPGFSRVCRSHHKTSLLVCGKVEDSYRVLQPREPPPGKILRNGCVWVGATWIAARLAAGAQLAPGVPAEQTPQQRAPQQTAPPPPPTPDQISTTQNTKLPPPPPKVIDVRMPGEAGISI